MSTRYLDQSNDPEMLNWEVDVSMNHIAQHNETISTQYFDLSDGEEMLVWEVEGSMNHELVHGWQDIGALFVLMDCSTTQLLPHSNLLRDADVHSGEDIGEATPAESVAEASSVQTNNQDDHIDPELLAMSRIRQPIAFATKHAGHESLQPPSFSDYHVPYDGYVTHANSTTPTMHTAMSVNNVANHDSFRSSKVLQHIPHWYNAALNMSGTGAAVGEATQKLMPQPAMPWIASSAQTITPPYLANLQPVTTRIRLEMASNNKEHVVITISNRFSDGNAQTILPKGYVAVDGTELYRKSMAKAWMEDQGHAVAGEKYILDALPDHYITAQNPSQPEDRHMYLFGHPSGKRYISARTFYVHFKHLKLYGTNHSCGCGNCQKGKARGNRSLGAEKGL